MARKKKVFISYASEDYQTALEIYEFLIENCCDPWLDRKKLLPGQIWEEEIEKAIESTDYFLACLSNRSVSKTGYVQVELKFAYEIWKKQPSGKIFLIPIQIEECAIPHDIRKKRIHYTNWSSDDSKTLLLKSLGVKSKSPKPSSHSSRPKSVPSKGNIITIDIPNLPTTAKPLEMVLIPAGTFQMGSPETEQDRNEDEKQHPVTISQPFYMGKYPITQAQWEAVMKNNNPSRFKGNPNHPVECVSWNDCQTFIQKLNQLGQGTFRLPTEEEWEYVCRAGTGTRFYWGDDPDYQEIDRYAWYHRNSNGQTHEVELKWPNAWGLYDMCGNVWEWCQDRYGTYQDGAQNDPTGVESGSFRVRRGGCWYGTPGWCRSAQRYGSPPGGMDSDLGFRVVASRT